MSAAHFCFYNFSCHLYKDDSHIYIQVTYTDHFTSVTGLSTSVHPIAIAFATTFFLIYLQTDLFIGHWNIILEVSFQVYLFNYLSVNLNLSDVNFTILHIHNGGKKPWRNHKLQNLICNLIFHTVHKPTDRLLFK